MIRRSSRTRIHPNAVISKSAFIEGEVQIGDKALVRAGATIRGPSYIDKKVTIGPRVLISKGAVILAGAQISPNFVRKHSSDGRFLRSRVTIGPGVFLHDEVELGEDAIIPSQRSIASLGNLGAKNRVVTIYGSDSGPLFSVGCQMGIDESTLAQRVGAHSSTTRDSANIYVPYMPILHDIGAVVQRAYDEESKFVGELKAMRAELF